MSRVVQLHWHLRPIAQQLSTHGVKVTAAILAGTETVENDEAEVVKLLAYARGLYDTIRDQISSVEATGAEVKDIETGLVDFSSLRDGTQEVMLCWRLGENCITHYHDQDSGYAGRQPVEGHEFVAAPRD